jgi:superfamily II DNA or RNA helicase
MFTLRPDQQRFIDLISESIAAGHRRILAQAPTGFGKGIVIANRAAVAAAKSRRVMVIAHREEIVSDLSDRIHRFGVPHGMVAAGRRMDLSHRVLVASIDTLIRRFDQLPPPDVILQDEAHHLVDGNKWGRVITTWPRAFLLGLTATPERLDGRGLGAGHGGYFTDLVLGPPASWLTFPGLEWKGLTSTGGLLSPLRVFLPPAIDLSSIAPRDRDTRRGLDAAGEILRRRQHMGDVISHYQRTIAPHHMGTALCYASSLRHAGDLCNTFREAGIAAIVIDGETDRAIRRQAFRDLGDGSLKVLINRDIAGEGTDVPSVTGVIVDRTTNSLALHLQMLGRSLRTAPGKEFAVCNDHVGNIGDAQGNTNLGLPTDPRIWSLEGRPKRQTASVDAEPHRNCPACFARVPARLASCDSCGFLFPPPPPAAELKQVDGDLVEFDAEAQAKAAAQKQRIQEERDCQSLDDFESLARARGYKAGWARRRWNLREKRRFAPESRSPSWRQLSASWPDPWADAGATLQ